MTGVIINAFNSVKHFILNRNFGRQQQVQEHRQLDPDEEGRPINNNRFLNSFQYTQGNREVSSGRSFFSNTTTTVRGKRPATERLIDIQQVELTDDEDDLPDNHLRPTKRFKAVENCNLNYCDCGNNMNPQDGGTNQNQRYCTRASGISPNIPGLDRQPWEHYHLHPTMNKQDASIEFCQGSLMKDQQPSTSQAARYTPRPEMRGNAVSASQNTAFQTEASKFRFSKPPIEVIQLDDDDENKSTSKSREPFAMPTKVQNVNKPFDHRKYFGSLISSVGKHVVNPLSNTIRLEERNQYRDLIRSTTMKNFSFSRGIAALKLSKVPQNEMKVVFNNWTISPKVSFKSKYAPVSSSKPKFKISERFQNDLRLFSTPTASRSSGSTPVGPITPVLIDLEEEEKEKNKSIVPPSAEEYNATDLNSTLVHLDDAFKSNLRRTSNSNELSLDSNDEQQGPSSPKQDEDITILSENILSKGRYQRVNSLALENNLSPYVKPSWLNGVSSSFRENQKQREKEIYEHLETVDVLNKESTLEKDIRERMRQRLTLTEIIVLAEPIPELPEITPQMRQIIDFAKRPGRDNEVLAQVFNIDFTRGDVKTLAPCKWLNDNVINVYMELIAQRSKAEGSSLPKVHVFTTFFYPKLLKEGYSNPLKRWTRKVDIFSHDLVIFPIHLGLHWCLACADLNEKSIKYYDSLGGRNDKCLKALMSYLTSELKERKGLLLDPNEWTRENVQDIPQQQNGSDCGVFTCKFAEYLSRNANLTFVQENMNYYRDRMIYEIIEKDLLYP